MNFSKQTFRASSVGTLLTKGGLASKTVQSYLLDIYTAKKYGLRKELTSKYLDSGKMKEDDSIKLLSEIDDINYLKNNTARKFNEFVEGDCDIWHGDKIIDIKSSWDIHTFMPHLLEDEIKNKLYEWQGISYCELYGAKEFELVYCLVDMPSALIKDEEKRLLYRFGTINENSNEYKVGCEELNERFNIASKMDLKSRVIRYKFEYNDEKKEKYTELCDRVKEARVWLNDFSQKELERIK
jgi:hypothetical protein